jgi:hypothetical protein
MQRIETFRQAEQKPKSKGEQSGLFSDHPVFVVGGSPDSTSFPIPASKSAMVIPTTLSSAKEVQLEFVPQCPQRLNSRSSASLRRPMLAGSTSRRIW